MRIDVDRIADDLTHALLHGLVASSRMQRAVDRLAARVAGLERRLARVLLHVPQSA